MNFLIGDPDDEQLDLFSDDEITEIINSIDRPAPVFPWLDFKGWQPKEYKCTCGSEVTYGKNALHSDWCDVK